jgi:hypothetical protein
MAGAVFSDATDAPVFLISVGETHFFRAFALFFPRGKVRASSASPNLAKL